VTELDELGKLRKLADDSAFRARFRGIKRANKLALGVDGDAMLAVQVKRFHEYKRQLLNVLHVIALWRRIKDGRHEGPPRTVYFAGKAAPGYQAAKLHIRLIHAVAAVVNKDVPERLKVVFSPNYRVSSAQAIIPAADLSEQISTAGFEASGTGNMKLMLNGAITIGTLDGANVEIREAVGDEHFFLFGLDEAGVVARKAAGYRPREELARSPELAQVIELIERDFFSPDDPGAFKPIVRSLLEEDRYLVLADFASYSACHEQVARAFLDPEAWTRAAILNVAAGGRFSSDRTIREYDRDIWGSAPVPTVMPPYEQPK
jgi:starch phosphorylase